MIISSGTKSDLLAFKSYNNQNNAVASIKSEQSCRYVDRGTCNVECIYILHTKKHDIPLLMSFRILIEFLSWKVVLWQPASCVRKRFVLVVTASAVMWVWGLGRDGAPVTACRTLRRGRGGRQTTETMPRPSSEVLVPDLCCMIMLIILKFSHHQSTKCWLIL